MTSTTTEVTLLKMIRALSTGRHVCEQRLGQDDDAPTSRDWYWAYDFLIDELENACDSADALAALAEVTRCAERFYTGDPDRWSVLWMLCLQCDTALEAGNNDHLLMAVLCMADRQSRASAG